MDTVKKSDITILMGDINAKVGNDNSGYERIMGQHGLGTRNHNGDLFAELCANYDLVIGGTIFPHKNVHKVTWKSPDNRTFNQIDHITIKKMWRRSLLDVRNKRGADIASDHHLLIGELRLKLNTVRKTQPETRRLKYNVSHLSSTNTTELFEKTISQKLKNIKYENPEKTWQKVTEILHETSEEILGISKNEKKPWISAHTWKLILHRKHLKGKLNQAQTHEERTACANEYQNANKRVKRSARYDKRKRMDGIAKGAQMAAELHNPRELYRLTRCLTNTNMSQDQPLRNKDGLIITSNDEQLEIWTKYFKDILSSHQSQPIPPIEAPRQNPIPLRINVEPPLLSEISNAIQQLKANKAAGPDNIVSEMLLAGVSNVSKILHPILEDIWVNESMPSQWKEGLIIKVPKKGDRTLCQNWRGITLLNTINKIIAQILLARISTFLEPKLRPQQAGFRPFRSCIDQINSLRIIIEQTNEWRSPLYLAFIDFKRAFDSLDHNSLWKVLENLGVPPKIINILKELYCDSSCCVLHKGRMGGKISIRAGVRQGCTLSPLLFNLVLDHVMRKATKEPRGIQWGLHDRLEDLDYADDICVLAHSFSDMQEKLNRIAAEAAAVGLHINVQKTKAMRIGTNNNSILKVYGEPVEEVDDFCYLGSTISKDGGANLDIASRIRKATSAFSMLNKVWTSSCYSKATKIKIFNSNVKSVLLYGCETWKATQDLTKRIQTFVNRCLRKIMRIFWPNTISNDDLLLRTKQTSISCEIKKRKWAWIGHTLRRPDNNIAKQALDWNPQGSRGRGRPKTTWKRTILKEAAEIGKTWTELKTLARNRVRWRHIVEALCSTGE